jgi:hypothetical protein
MRGMTGTSKHEDGHSSANASTAGWMEKSCVDPLMRPATFAPRGEPRPTERAARSHAESAHLAGQRFCDLAAAGPDDSYRDIPIWARKGAIRAAAP